MKPVQVLGIAGSVRKASYDRSARRASKNLRPEGATLDVFELDGIPGFNEDDEKSPPAEVVDSKKRMRAADRNVVRSAARVFVALTTSRARG